jgi:hypothetical protein
MTFKELTPKQEAYMREWLAHEDEYTCIFLINKIAGLIKDKDEFHKVIGEIHQESLDHEGRVLPKLKADNLRKYIKSRWPNEIAV